MAFRFMARKKTQLKWFPSAFFSRTNTQLVNAQSTYANLLQFEIESKRLGNIKGNDSTGSGLSGGQRQQHGRRKKVRSMKLASLVITFYLFHNL